MKKRINRLKQVLEEVGMTQKEFAKMWDKSISQVNKICKQHSQFKTQDLPEIAKILGVTMDKLIVAEYGD